MSDLIEFKPTVRDVPEYVINAAKQMKHRTVRLYETGDLNPCCILERNKQVLFAVMVDEDRSANAEQQLICIVPILHFMFNADAITLVTEAVTSKTYELPSTMGELSPVDRQYSIELLEIMDSPDGMYRRKAFEEGRARQALSCLRIAAGPKEELVNDKRSIEWSLLYYKYLYANSRFKWTTEHTVDLNTQYLGITMRVDASQLTQFIGETFLRVSPIVADSPVPAIAPPISADTFNKEEDETDCEDENENEDEEGAPLDMITEFDKDIASRYTGTVISQKLLSMMRKGLLTILQNQGFILFVPDGQGVMQFYNPDESVNVKVD